MAWANFINGAGPGSHGIFDFIHRNPAEQCSAVNSLTETVPGEGGLEIGKNKIQLDVWPFNHKLPRTIAKRQGVPFWDYLDAAGVPSTFYDLPSNYPASPSHHGHHRCICGMELRTCWAPMALTSTLPKTDLRRPRTTVAAAESGRD